MKLKQRIILGFLMIILVPMLLLAATLYGFSEAQHRSTSKNEAVQEADYDITIGETGVDGSGLRIMTKDLFFTALVILIFTSVSVGLWIYRSVATPLVKLRRPRRISKTEILILFLMWKGRMSLRNFVVILRK